MASLAPRIAGPVQRDGTYALIVVNHAPELHDTAHVETALRKELGDRVRDQAESDRFLRVTLEKRQLYVEVVERASRRVSYLHEYALDFCGGSGFP